MPDPRRPVPALPAAQTVMFIGNIMGFAPVGNSIQPEVINVNRTLPASIRAAGEASPKVQGTSIAGAGLSGSGSGSAIAVGVAA